MQKDKTFDEIFNSIDKLKEDDRQYRLANIIFFEILQQALNNFLDNHDGLDPDKGLEMYWYEGRAHINGYPTNAWCGRADITKYNGRTFVQASKGLLWKVNVIGWSS